MSNPVDPDAPLLTMEDVEGWRRRLEEIRLVASPLIAEARLIERKLAAAQVFMAASEEYSKT